jgi:hypothetical protein
MKLFKRQIGRVAAVGVGVTLLVLGLEAPGLAAVPPTVTSFAPASGPTGCVIDIIGTGFTTPTVTAVDIGGTAVSDFAVQSDTEILATVASSASGLVNVTNGGGTGSSTTQFSSAMPGGCAPTAASFTPTCGPAKPSTDPTDVTVTGTNLMKSSTAGADVYFGSTTTADSGVKAGETTPATAPSLTSRTITVPAGATDGPIAVETFNNVIGQGGDFTPTKFLVGSCVTDMKPASGDVGTTVTLTGVGFKNVTAVAFTGAGSTTVPATFTIASDTTSTDTITTTVPFGAITGPITLSSVDAPDGKSFQSADFTVGKVTHKRNISLRLRRHLVARGKVTVPDGFSACAANVPVRIQRRASGHWKTIARTSTNSNGAYQKRIRNKHGKYRSMAPQVSASGESCLVATSRVVTH